MIFKYTSTLNVFQATRKIQLTLVLEFCNRVCNCCSVKFGEFAALVKLIAILTCLFYIFTVFCKKERVIVSPSVYFKSKVFLFKKNLCSGFGSSAGCLLGCCKMLVISVISNNKKVNV